MRFLCHSAAFLYTSVIRDRKNHGKNGKKNTAHFCDNRKNHGKIKAVYIAAILLKLMVSNSRKNIFSDHSDAEITVGPYADFHGSDAKSRHTTKITVKSTVILNT